jgi:UPF0716 protein FxsA
MPSPNRVALLLMMIALPLLEIAILIEVGQVIGFWPSVLLLLGAALFGAKIVHDQGLATARRAAEALAEGTPPVGPMLEGVALVIAGTLLILPGYLSDVAGLLLMIESLRRFAILSVLRRFRDAAHRRFPERRSQRPPPEEPQRPLVIEGEFERLDERTIDPKRDRGGRSV